MIKTWDSIKKLFWHTKLNVFQTTLGNRKKEIESLKRSFIWMVTYGRNKNLKQQPIYTLLIPSLDDQT